MPEICTIGPLMVDVQGLSLTSAEKEILSSPVVGGLILFSRNFRDADQLSSLISEIRACSPNIIIAVDHEGGRVQRFKEGFTRIPPMASLGQLYKSDKVAAIKSAYELGWLFASELISFDIDISFAPVLDRDYGVSQVIGDRAFSSEIDEIVELSSSLIKGMRDAGMASTGKHFPGHGAVVADSHLEIPIDDRNVQSIKDDDMIIFSSLISKGLDAIMPAHVIYESVDKHPAGFSKIWMEEVLRGDLGFEGVIFSDDLSMEGASVAGGFTERANAALDAGCDMILVCNNPTAAKEVQLHLENLISAGKLKLNNARLQKMRLKQDKKVSINNVKDSFVWQKYNN